MKKHCPEVNWNIVDSLTCNITGYHLHMGHYSFDYDKCDQLESSETEFKEQISHQRCTSETCQANSMHVEVQLRLSGKLEDYLSVSNQQVSVSVLYYGIGNCMRTTVCFSYVKEG
ncbi:hypothetical protein T06_10332 [Trichinella sp. T6]|nr:hypothetical protein T06_10332 [Trichinella sp. T6]